MAAYADDISLLPLYPVLLCELVEAVGVAGFQENQDLAFLAGGLDQVFGQVVSAEAVVASPALISSKSLLGKSILEA